MYSVKDSPSLYSPTLTRFFSLSSVRLSFLFFFSFPRYLLLSFILPFIISSLDFVLFPPFVFYYRSLSSFSLRFISASFSTSLLCLFHLIFQLSPSVLISRSCLLPFWSYFFPLGFCLIFSLFFLFVCSLLLLLVLSPAFPLTLPVHVFFVCISSNLSSIFLFLSNHLIFSCIISPFHSSFVYFLSHFGLYYFILLFSFLFLLFRFSFFYPFDFPSKNNALLLFSFWGKLFQLQFCCHVSSLLFFTFFIAYWHSFPF